MPLTTTTIGAYPKPDFLALPDWFTVKAGPDTDSPTAAWLPAMAALGTDAEALLASAAQQVIADQVEAGIDVPTDGEVRRENYIHYHCRHLAGFDFEQVEQKLLRNGAYRASLPCVRAAIRAEAPFLVHDWQVAQATTDRPVKVTMPGPLTIADTVVNRFYGDERQLCRALAEALNAEAHALAAAGCLHIQIDEPVFARKPAAALAYGIDNLNRALHGLPREVTRTVHMCCGYPDRLDNLDYPKADPGAYLEIAQAVDAADVDAVSLEDAHRHNPLSLLEQFTASTVVLGAVGVVTSRVESVDAVRERLLAALEHIDRSRLMAAPDCGLGLLGRDLARAKLKALTTAAQSV